MQDKLRNEYFEWLYELVCSDRFAKTISYRKLIMLLHDTEFTHIIPKDANRAEDGVDLRYRFTLARGYDINTDRYLDGPCTVLEMMVALAIRCEETIMDNPNMGDRTGQWFWGMISNLGLGAMTDDRFNKKRATDIITRFLNREYEANGKGGLFTVRHSDRDLRDVEIWYQLCWYLDSIT